MCLRDEDNMGGVVSIVHLGDRVVHTFSYPKEGTKLNKPGSSSPSLKCLLIVMCVDLLDGHNTQPY